MLIGFCLEQASDYSVMLRDLKLLLCKGNDAFLLLFCLKYANDEQKLRWDWDYSETGTTQNYAYIRVL